MRKFAFPKGIMSAFLSICFLLTAGQQEGRLPVVNDAAKNVSDKTGRLLLRSQAEKVVQQGALGQRNATSLVGTTDVLVNNNNGVLASGAGQFTQSETSTIAWGNNVVIGYNDAGSVSAGNHFTGWSYSSDGGATFTDGGVLPNSAGGDAGDPILVRNNTTGRIYFLTLNFTTGNTIQLFRSDDNGVTWSAPVNATPGGAGEDKPWVEVDNYPGAGNGNVYLLSRNFGAGNGIYFYKSTDHGLTFSPNGGTLIASGAAGNVQGTFITVSPDHSLHAFYFDDVANNIKVRKSTDFGATWGLPIVVASGLPAPTNGNLGLTGIRQGLAAPATFRSNAFPHAVSNPANGNLYVVYNNDGAGIDRADVFLVQSTDGGATWSAPVKVNDDGTTTDQWMPTVAVMGDGSQVGIFYYSRQEDVANNNLFKYYGRIARVSGGVLLFDPGFAVSDVPSLPEFGRDNVVNAVYMGDYNTVATTPNYFHVVWSDNRDDLANGAPRKDPNVYYDKVYSPSSLPGKNILVSPTAVNYGQVPLGNTVGPTLITMVNIGDEALTVSSISTPGGDFALSGVPSLPLVIPIGGSSSFNVSFTPSSGGPKSASINIASDAVNTPIATVNLQGFGLPPTNINVTPSPLVINVAHNGTGSGVLNITNVNEFANDLNWVINDLDKPYLAKTSDQPGGPVFNWVDISATGTAVTTGDDVLTSSIPLPFTFPFFGQNKTALFISSNGLLAFNSTNAATFTNASIPTLATPNDLIAPFWDDLFPTAGSVRYLSSPTEFIVQYTNVPRFVAGSNLTFQVILRPDGSIVYQYLTMTGTLNSATIGIENGTGNEGLQLAFNAPYVQNNFAVRISARPISECTLITSITPFSGTTAGNVTSQSTIGVDATGLNCGTYNCSVTVSSNAANTPVLVVPVVLNVQAPFTCSITSVPSNNTYTGGVPTNIYIGYGPQSTTLQSSISGAGGPFTYSWSPTTGLSSSTSSAPLFTPTAAGAYTFTLTVTGAGGCTTTCNITINVYDVRVPGTNGKKVYLCHAPPDNPANTQTLEVNVNAVAEHLADHPGDHLGECDLVIAPARNPIQVDDVLVRSSDVFAYPNPNNGEFDLQLNNLKAGKATIRIINSNGAIVQSRSVDVRTNRQVIHFALKGQSAGLYHIQIIHNEGVQNLKFVIRR